MNTYTKNYWSLYLDFIADFKEVSYNGYRLSYLVHFPSVLRDHPTIWQELLEDSFQSKLKHRVTDHKQVQTVFSDYLDTLKSSHSPKNGTIGIIDDSLTRLPPDTIKQYVNQDDLIIIKTNKQSKNITNKRQVNLLDFFPTETKQAKIKIKQQIDTIIEQSPRKNFYKEI